MSLSSLFNVRAFASLFFVVGQSAYAASNSTDPDDLQAPQQVTCVFLSEPLELTALYGAFNVQWTTKLEKGAYWSEKIDADGTYFRAPIGGVSVKGKSGGAFPGQPTTTDGGFYLNAGVGKIVWIQPPVKDSQFLQKLKALADTQVPVREAQLAAAPTK